MFKKILKWVDCRIGLSDLVEKELRQYHLPRDVSFWSTLGFITLIAFIIQATTGVFLLLYYIPHPDYAFESIKKIMNEVSYGWLFRYIHIIGANLIVLLLFLHTLFVFYRAGYKKPRELNWLTGVIMFFLILLSCLTGYLLPWSQLSYWSTTILTAIPTLIPGIGEGITHFIRGSDKITGVTLTRFFAFHVAFLPFLLIIFSAIHLFLIWRTGYSSLKDDPSICKDYLVYTGRPVYKEGPPFYPDFFSKEMRVMLFYFIVMFGILTLKPDLFLPDYSFVKADPQSTPLLIRPPWYLLAPYTVVREVPNKILAIAILFISFCLFFLWPFIDIKEEKDIKKRPLLFGFFITAIIVWFVLSIWGTF